MIRSFSRTLAATLVTLSFALGFALALPQPAHAADDAKAVAFKKGSAKAYTGQVNINTATATELTLLPGIGPAKAQRIIDLREKRAFKRPAELVRVKGIGPKTVKKLMPHIKVSGSTDFKVQ